MSKTKHTPGPWKVGEENEFEAYEFVSITTESGVQIGDVSSDGCVDDETHANARLIAAAPDMLAALKQIESEMRAGLGSSYGETREAVRRAIAKAEGL